MWGVLVFGDPKRKPNPEWDEVQDIARVRLCHHRDWYQVGSTYVQCAKCGVLVSDMEVRRFAKNHGVSSDAVRPGTILAKKLHAPWG